MPEQSTKEKSAKKVIGRISQVIGVVVNVKFDNQEDLPSMKSE